MSRPSILSLLAALAVIVYALGLLISPYLSMSSQVGVVQLVGPIYSFRDITQQISSVNDDSRIKAMVLYVNSPGGGAYSCMEIRRYLDNMTKPNIAVIDEIGASGAYYIASAADEILAHENTVTGSIGVISIWEDYSEWLESEGIKYWVWKTGDAKDLFEPWRSPTAEENKTIETQLNRTYEILIGDIASGRQNLTVEEVREFANGSVFLGSEALELKLIDEIGDYKQAVKMVSSRIDLGAYITRDMATGDRAVLASLMESYIFSGLTVGLIVLLVVLGLLAILTRRRAETKGEPSTRFGI